MTITIVTDHATIELSSADNGPVRMVAWLFAEAGSKPALQKTYAPDESRWLDQLVANAGLFTHARMADLHSHYGGKTT